MQEYDEGIPRFGNPNHTFVDEYYEKHDIQMQKPTIQTTKNREETSIRYENAETTNYAYKDWAMVVSSIQYPDKPNGEFFWNKIANK